MIQIQDNISEQKSLKDKLESEQEKLHVEYNKVSQAVFTVMRVSGDLLQKHMDCEEGVCPNGVSRSTASHWRSSSPSMGSCGPKGKPCGLCSEASSTR